MRGQRHAPVALYPRERPGTHCTRGWVGPRAGLERCEKPRPPPPPGFDPRTVQPVASRYTDYASRPTEMTVPAEYALSRHCKQSLVLGVLGVTHDQSAWIVCPPEDSKQTGTVEAAGLGVKKYYEMPWN
jgi:hypothetical protein